MTARSSHAADQTNALACRYYKPIVAARESAHAQRHGMSFGWEFRFLGSKQAADRWPQYAPKERSPLQLAMAIAATLVVPLVFCSTPEALNHIIHAPSKGGARRKRRANRHVSLLQKSYQLAHPQAF